MDIRLIFFNSNLSIISRFLVRTIWKGFERIRVNDPTSAAKNYNLAKKIEKKLKKWSILNNTMIIAGHTHRKKYPKIGESLYFNDGCCVYLDGITCLEIYNGRISLVRWEFKVNSNRVVSIERKILTKEENIDNFYR